MFSHITRPMGLKLVECVTRSFFTSRGGLPVKWCTRSRFGNPVDDLQELLEVPLLNANEVVLTPTEQEIIRADELFRRLPVEALNGVIDFSSLPSTDVPEVCFIGQSNVGKSSLIKTLLNERKKVKIYISKTPGCTTTLNFYRLGRLMTLVDVPGHGENMPEHYVQSVEQYIRTRKNLVRTFLLVDGAIGLTDIDKMGIEMMEEFGKPYLVVMTKIDKTSHHAVLRNLFEMKRYRDKNMPSALPQIFLVSAHQEAGIPLLRSLIMYVTGNVARNRSN